jgi:redox-sensing transcriptional repressor
VLTRDLRGACGLYTCGKCTDYRSGLCPGCEPGNERRRQEGGLLCAVYLCAREDGVESCRKCARSDCTPLTNLSDICPLRTQTAIGDGRTLGRGVEVDVSLSLAKHLSNLLDRRRHGHAPPPKIPERAVVRMRWYMQCLEDMAAKGVDWVSSAVIGEQTGVEAWLVRKDLSYFGEFGRPRRGYQPEALLARLGSIFQPKAPKRVAWLGVTCERIAPLIRQALEDYNCGVVAVFDGDSATAVSPFPGLPVLPLDRVPEVVGEKGIDVCVVCVSGEEVWRACDKAAAAGARVVLNMTPDRPQIASPVTVWEHSIHSDLFVVSYYAAGTGATRRGKRAKQVAGS